MPLDVAINDRNALRLDMIKIVMRNALIADAGTDQQFGVWYGLAAFLKADAEVGEPRDGEILAVVERLEHPPSRAAFEAERGLVARVGGGCALPLGAYAEQRDEAVRLLAVVVRPDGSDLVWSQAEAPTPEEAAEEAATTLLAGGAGEILAETGGA